MNKISVLELKILLYSFMLHDICFEILCPPKSIRNKNIYLKEVYTFVKVNLWIEQV